MTTDKAADPSEVDTCRICSGPAEEDQPLFYPCKCSGTIRYIHQDCLTTWLAHSKKRSCDVCKYEYGFTKVYKTDMPRRLPPRLFFQKLTLQMAKVVITSLRLVMISVIWLAILPYLTLWVWRFYFWTGEALAYWVVGKEIPNRTYSPPKPPSEPLTEDTPSTPPPPQSPWFNVNILPHELGADIFKGQIITIAVVIVFLTIFLLREWIIQNARPGVFGDEEPAEPVAVVPDAAPVEIPQEPAAGAAIVAAQLLNALEPVEAFEEPLVELLPEAEDDVEQVEPELRQGFFDEYDALTDDPIEEGEEDSASAHTEDDVASIPSNSEGEYGQVEAPTLQAQSLDTPTEQTLVPQEAEDTSLDDTSAIPSSSKLDQSSNTVFGASTKLGNDLSLPSSFAFSSPATTSGSLGASIESSLDGSRPADSQMFSSLSTDATQSRFQASVADFSFTFSAPHPPSTQEEALNVPLPDSPVESRSTIFGALGSDSTPMPSGPIAIPTPRPHQIRSSRAGPSKRMTSSTPAFNKNTRDFDEFRFSFSSTPTTLSQGSSRHSSRPPLPPSTPGVDEPTPLVDSGTASPQVALYRPPEDLSGATQDYFDRFPIASSSKTAFPQSYSAETEKPAENDDEHLQKSEPSSDEEEPYIVQPPRLRPADDREAPMREFEQQRDVRRRGLAQAPPIAPLPAPPLPVDEEEDDVDEDPQDIEPMGDDDMDGALEAIGMRGPITSVFQNVFLMIFIIDLAIAVGIWMPFTMGKTTALLFLQPADVLALIRLPIIAVRVMTDPIVDSLLFLLNLLIRPIKWGIGHLLPSVVLVSKQAATVTAPPAPKAGLSLAVIQNAVFRHWDRLLEHSHAAANASAPRPSPTNAIERLVFRLPAPSVQSLEHVESRFTAFGRAVRLFSHAFARRWQQLALADGTSERAFAIGLGYAVLCMVMGIYLGVLNAGAVRGAARALRNAVKQQLIVVKVALFIGLELLVFPTGCGVVLDIATLPLFESATLAGRVAFYDFAPLTAFFCHWLVGTIFMYQFALTLGACRAVMRPGAMWFIKDPQDASFSPIRDILDKRVLTQLRKLAVSAVMYTVVIVVAVGSVVYTIRYAPIFSGILPLRGNMREPLSEIPVDLLFLHLVMPPTVKRLTIGSWVRARLEVWWKYTARQLRLSSFMFNKLYADELQRESRGLRSIEGPTEGWTIPQDEQLYGRWLRVPKSDNIAFLRDQPVLIEVNHAGQAVRQRGREVMAEQDEETRRAGRQPEQDYIIVHVPPYFGARCMMLIILLWLTAAAVTVVGTAGPVVLGRWLLKIFARKTNVHDGYSLVLGWYVLWGAWRAYQSQVRSWTTAVAWLANVIWIALGMGVVMPILVAITLQLYVVLPLRVAWDPTMVPVIRVVEEWALGLVLMKIGWQTWRLRNRGRAGAGVGVGAEAVAAPVPADGAAAEEDEVDEADRRVEDLGRAMEQIVRAGLANPDAITATQTFIAPVCGGLLLVIGGPALAVWALGRGGEDVLLTTVYPGIFSLTAAVGVWRAGTKVGKKWLQDVRDAEFLVEMRLKNLEPVR